MYTPRELEAIPKQFERYMQDLEARVMLDVIQRIKKNKEITSTADWRLLIASELRGFDKNLKKEIKKALGLSTKEINALYKNTISSGYARDESLYKSVGKPFVPFKDNKELQQAIQATMAQTNDTLKNITNTLGFVVNVKGNMVFTPASAFFSDVLDGAMIDITSGAFDYNSTIKRVIAEMTKSGLRTVDYASGYSNRIDVAVRRAVMTGVNQISAKISEQNAQKLDTEHFEVTWHGTARPTHQEWQGKVFTKDELISICGYGTVGGLCGANCMHNFYPFIEGISERTYTDKQLVEMNAKENELKGYRGKEYTSYEASQKQRKLETLMRKQRQDINLLEHAEVDEDDIINVRCKYRQTMSEYVKFSKKMDLPQQRQRVYGDELGNIGVGKTKARLTNAVGKPIIEVKKTSIIGEPNSITQKTSTRGGIDRNYYDENGNQVKQISNNSHGHKVEGKLGKHGEHAHDYHFDENGINHHGKARELTEEERKENSDIL